MLIVKKTSEDQNTVVFEVRLVYLYVIFLVFFGILFRIMPSEIKKGFPTVSVIMFLIFIVFLIIEFGSIWLNQLKVIFGGNKFYFEMPKIFLLIRITFTKPQQYQQSYEQQNIQPARTPDYDQSSINLKTSPLATWALVSGIIGFIIPILPSIIAIILGIIAIKKINKDPNLKGKGLAIAGLVIGIFQIVILLFIPSLLLRILI